LTLIPFAETANDLHELIPIDKITKGFTSRGVVEVCIDRVFTNVFGNNPYPDIFTQAAALLYSFISFHPYVDENKRTALLITTLFLALNGYHFNFPKDIVEFMKTLADPKIQGTKDDINRIARWIKNGCSKNEIYGIDEDILHEAIKNNRVSFLGVTVKMRKVS
jgi:death-on-curing family protein